MGLDLTGVQKKHGSYYRRYKVKKDGRWVDRYIRLPALDEPGFAAALAKANADAVAKGINVKGQVNG